MKSTEAQSNTIKARLEKKEPKVKKNEYQHSKKGMKAESKETLAVNKKMVRERVKDLDEDKGTIPVFQKTKKGLKFLKHHKQS